MSREIIARAEEIIKRRSGGGNEGYCTLALIDLDGFPTASTISVSKADGIKQMTFCTGLEGSKASRISQNCRASVCFNDVDYNITLVGTIEILTDLKTKREMWYEGLINHYSGPDDSGYCVLLFKTKRYNLLIDWIEAEGIL